jgi:hypothetical protein
MVSLAKPRHDFRIVRLEDFDRLLFVFPLLCSFRLSLRVLRGQPTLHCFLAADTLALVQRCLANPIFWRSSAYSPIID